MLNLLSIKISRFARNDKKRNCDTVSRAELAGALPVGAEVQQTENPSSNVSPVKIW